MKWINLRDGLLWLYFVPLLIPLNLWSLGIDLGHPFGGFAQSHFIFQETIARQLDNRQQS